LPLVVGLGGFRQRSPVLVERRLPAVSRIPVILSFGDVVEIDMAGRTSQLVKSFVAGLHSCHAVTRFQGAQGGIQVDLTPMGVYRIFGIPGAEIADRIVDIGDISAALGGSLPDRLASLGSWSRRLALVEELLASLAATGPEPDPMVTWMWYRLRVSGGRARVSHLVSETGRSHRHVAARFRDQVGVTPKTAANIFRFEHAARALSLGQGSLAEVAVGAGYTDQSHLTREFRRLAGGTPGTFAAPFVAELS
jgi:AraC-like DNA-binding protein